MKKFLILILIIVFTAITAVGCGQGTGESDKGAAAASDANATENQAPETAAASKQIKLIFTGIGIALKDSIDPKTNKKTEGWETFVGRDLKNKFPNVNLKLNTIPWENYRAKMQTILQSKSTDILYASGAFVAAFYKQGLLMGLNQFINSDTNFKYEDIYPAGLKKNLNLTDYSMNEVVALPYMLGYRILIYDKQLFDDWGVPYLSDHPTPDEIAEKAAKMTGKNPKTGKQNYGLWFDGKTPNISWFIQFGYYFNVKGCENSLDDLKNLKWSVNSPEVLKTLQWFVDNAKYCPPGFVNAQGMENFGKKTNDVAIAIDTNGVNIMKEYNDTKDQSILDRFIPTQSVGPKGEGWTVADGIAMSTSVKPEDQKMAWEVCKYIAGPEAQKWYNNQYGPWPMGVKDTSLYDQNNKYILMNIKVSENSHSSSFEELNPFFVSNVQPLVVSAVSKAASGSKLNLQADLDALQKKAEIWSAGQ